MATAEELFSLGRTRHGNGDLAGAAALYEQIVAADPLHAETWYLLGAARCGLGQLEAAIACLQRAAEIQPHQPQVHDILGVALFQAGRMADAETSFRRAVQLAPGNVEAQQHLGAVLVRLQNFADALPCCRVAVASNAARSGGAQQPGRGAQGFGVVGRSRRLLPAGPEARRELRCRAPQSGRHSPAAGSIRRSRS